VWLRARDRWSRSSAEPDDLAGPMSGAEDRLIVRFS
jgi:hypothetical protein